jgi:hypothetical protein
MAEKASVDVAEWYRLGAASLIDLVTDSATFTRLLSAYYSLESAYNTEWDYLYGTSWSADFMYLDVATTDPCLFKTCTNQYWSQKSASSISGELFYPSLSSPCCGSCTIYADGVSLLYWPTPNPTPSVTAYQFKVGTPKNYTNYTL